MSARSVLAFTRHFQNHFSQQLLGLFKEAFAVGYMEHGLTSSSFVPLIPTKDTSFGNAIPMTQSSVNDLFGSLSLNSEFILNLLGRPDYWAPQQRWDLEGSKLLGCDFFCQHPRWNLQAQGAPLSIYMKHDVQRDLTVYIISHKQNDTIVKSLRSLLNATLRHKDPRRMAEVLLESPFDIHAMISTLSLEASKFHVKRFQRVMWESINKVDDHLAGLETSDRSKLSDLTKQLQIVSQNLVRHFYIRFLHKDNVDKVPISAQYAGIDDLYLRQHRNLLLD